MWEGTSSLSEITQGNILTVIMEFDSGSSLSPGEYSFHLRDDTSADTAEARFTVDNTLVSVSLTGGSGLQESKAEYPLTLAINPGYDTRLSEGTAAIFTLDDGQPFPEGTVFTHKGINYAPVDGKVYMPLDTGVNSHTIVMDTRASSGLAEGEHHLTAKILSIGLNAGNKVISSDGKVTYMVKAAPQYGLKVESEDSRNVSGGSTLSFTVTHSLSNIEEESPVIGVTARKKDGGIYGAEENWKVEGNKVISLSGGTADGFQNIKVTVPTDTTPGTYRLVFKLGNQTAVYNIIVVSADL